MRPKNVSKRRWKARMMQGLWIPRMVVDRLSLTAPEGYTMVRHPEEDFLMVMPSDAKIYGSPYFVDDVKRAWQ
jgi:hypothetical protein